MMIAVIGQASFIAQHLQKNTKSQGWLYLSRREALEQAEWLENVELIINCAFSPRLFASNYTSEEDIDSALAQKISHHQHVRYMMLSSRAVYGDIDNLQEERSPQPANHYGRAKHIIEQNLTDILGSERLTILRCSNIFGLEPGRKSFMGTAQTTLKEKGVITLNLSPKTEKDFMPVEACCETIANIAQGGITGTYNLGSGTSIPCGEIAESLIAGYGSGALEIIDETIKGRFHMDITKLSAMLPIQAISEEIIKDKCKQLGQALRAL